MGRFSRYVVFRIIASCKFNHSNIVTEFTVRSMMGGFEGYAGLFEFLESPKDSGSYFYHFSSCRFVPMPLITVLFFSWITWFLLALLFSAYLVFRGSQTR